MPGTPAEALPKVGDSWRPIGRPHVRAGCLGEWGGSAWIGRPGTVGVKTRA